jgi:CBS domain-containing protein
MSGHEDAGTVRDGAQSPAAALIPAPERYPSALHRYVAALSSDEQRPDFDGAVQWTVDNAVVDEVMTRLVVCVDEDAPFTEILDKLAAHRIGAVPVIDADRRVLGVVSVSDLLTKLVVGDAHTHAIVADHETRKSTRRKAQAETAGQLMTSPAITVSVGCSVVQAARTAARTGVRRLPVLDERGALAGIVSRSDLLHVFRHDDSALRTHLVADILLRQFCLEASAVEVTVLDGVVTLTGQVETGNIIAPLLATIRATAGVVAVHERLTYPHQNPPPALPLQAAY